jgi:hypothetical protein
MALTGAEKAQRFRDRQKAKRLDQLKGPGLAANDLFRRPFFEAVAENGNYTSVQIALEVAGIEPPSFDDDRGPTALALKGVLDEMESPFSVAENSLGRAETMVGCFLDAAVELAGIVNTFKQEEIAARLAEIEQQELTDPAKRKNVVAQIVRLNNISDKLKKQIRWTLPQWKID